MLNGVKPADERTIVVGAGLVGCETALWLTDQGKPRRWSNRPQNPGAGGPLCHANSDMLQELMAFKAIKVMTSSVVDRPRTAASSSRPATRRLTSRRIRPSSAIGYIPSAPLRQVRNKVPEAYLFGDARRVQNIMYAIWDAYEVARSL